MLTIDWNKFETYLKFERGVTPGSSFRSNFRSIIAYFKSIPFNRENLRIMLSDLSKKGLTNATLNRYLRVVKHIDAYLETNILHNFKNLPQTEPAKDKSILTDIEMRKIAECRIKKKYHPDENKRYHAAIQTLRFTGMRPDELCSLTWAHDHTTHFLLTETKTKKNRQVPIPTTLRTILNALSHYSHNYIFGTSRGKLFPATLNSELRARCKKLGIQKYVTCYTFRYSVATWCALNGGEGTLPRIAKIMGHSLETSFRYYQQYDVGQLLDALESSHPGLRKAQNIDVMKRIITEFVKRLVDMSKFDVSLEIIPKTHRIRKIYLS